MKRFLIHTFGCQMNAHDSRRIAEVLYGEGYAETDDQAQADLIVFNTCSVREKAEHKLVSALGRMRELKQKHRGLRIAVAGCMVQEHGDALLERLDLADVMIGPDNIAELPELLRDAEAGKQRLARIEFDLDAPRFLTAIPRPDGREFSAYVTVMKGCDERCSFCIVPYTRGAERYRPADEIVAEVAQLADGGVREVTLLGQTVNSWHDEVAPDEPSESRFAELLYRIANEVPALSRLRYTSPHPRHVTPALVRAHAELPLLPAHVHLPVQSGSDRVLKRMIRRYTRELYVERARALQAARPGLTLSTDIIVGFPGETEEDFQQTLSLVEEVGFVSAFGFKYSPRPHTPALKLGDDIAEDVKSDRLARLFERCDRVQQRHLRELVGSRALVLFEGTSKSAPGNRDASAQAQAKRTPVYVGRTDRHEIVHVQAEPGCDLSGLLLEVEIVEANKRSLFGRLVGQLPSAAFVPAAMTQAALPASPRRLPVVSP